MTRYREVETSADEKSAIEYCFKTGFRPSSMFW